MDIPILGVGMTRFGELWERSLVDLATEAGKEAIEDSRIDARKIDAVVVGNMLAERFENQGHLGAVMASLLGIGGSAVRVEGACASGGLAIRTGIEKLLADTSRTVLVIGVEKMTDHSTSWTTEALMGASMLEEREAGVTFPALYALITRAYMEKYRVTERDLAAVPVKNHDHGLLNPKAHFRFPISVEEVLASPPVASPLKLLECSPLSDGAAAVVLGRPMQRRNGAVRIIGSGQGVETVGLSRRSSLTRFSATRKAAAQAFAMAGLDPTDVDIIEVHDCFSIGEVLALEDLGFAPEGEGWVIAGNGECRIGGRRPTNTSGGLKACGHPVGATGVKQIVELVLQLRGLAEKRQVPKARIGLAHNVGGVGGTALVHLLRVS